jgi:hypothetical protein
MDHQRFPSGRRQPTDRPWQVSGRQVYCPIASAMLMRAANVNMAYAPFPGAPAVNALLEQPPAYAGEYVNAALLSSPRPALMRTYGGEGEGRGEGLYPQAQTRGKALSPRNSHGFFSRVAEP